MKNIYPTLLRFGILLWMVFLYRAQALAQQKKAHPTIFAGQIIHHFDYFWSDDWLNSDAIYKRPQFLNRLSINLQIAKGKFDMPMQIMLTAPYKLADRNLIGPTNFEDYLQMPGTVLGLQPSFRKFRVLLGSHTANLSPLTAGNIAFSPEAAGLEFTPGGFCIKASYGITHRGIDNLGPFQGQYQRRMLTAQLGFGNDAKAHIMLNWVSATDYLHTPAPFPTRTLADGSNLSLKFKIQASKELYWRGEFALGAHTNDKFNPNPPTKPIHNRAPNANASTVGDAAIDTELGVIFKNWNLALAGKYIGANYRSMAYIYQVPGHLDLTASLNLNPFKHKLSLHGTAGLRENYVATDSFDRKDRVSDQAIINASGHLQLTKRLGFDAHYYNFAWQQPVWFDGNQIGITAKIRQTTASLGGSAHLRLGNKRSHIFTASYSQDEYQDRYLLNPSGASTIRATVAGIHYQRVNRKQNGLTLGANQFDYQESLIINQNAALDRMQWNAYAGFQHYFFHQRLQMMGQFQYSNRNGAIPGDMYLVTATAATKFFKKKLQYTCQVNVRLQTLPTGNVQMFFMRQSLQYQF